MKKTLVAMAAIAATASFAQSSVVLSGNLDGAYVSRTGTVARQAGTTFTTGVGTSSTTSIKLTATEDLGAGMKAVAMYELDPRSLIDDSYAVNLTPNASGSTTTGNTAIVAATVTGLGRHEAYVGLSGGFGQIQLGAPNAPSLDVNGASSPLGTGIGSGYTAYGTSGTNWNSALNTRYSRSAKWISPTMNGFTLSVSYAPGNDQSNTAVSSNLGVPNARQATDVGIKYSNGPLNVAYAYVTQGSQTNHTGWFGVNSGSATLPYASTSVNALPPKAPA